MDRKRLIAGLVLTLLIGVACVSLAGAPCTVQLFFGLSRPGGGGVSLDEWQQFEKKTLAGAFEGFTVADAVGYYKGKAERAKLVMIVVDDEAGVLKAKTVAKAYAKAFGQDSVMLLKTPVLEWSFVGSNANLP